MDKLQKGIFNQILFDKEKYKKINSKIHFSFKEYANLFNNYSSEIKSMQNLFNNCIYKKKFDLIGFIFNQQSLINDLINLINNILSGIKINTKKSNSIKKEFKKNIIKSNNSNDIYNQKKAIIKCNKNLSELNLITNNYGNIRIF